MMYVKICGITNWDDALAAVVAGADYLGFIFYERSKRFVAAETVRGIVTRLRTRPDCPQLVGVFVNDSAETMAHILDTCDLDLAQLSGTEVPKLASDPDSPIYGRSYKAIRPSSVLEAEADGNWFRAFSATNKKMPSILVDAYHPTEYGGTGQTGDWAIAAQLRRKHPKLMLAGGLTPDNVAAAIAQVNPFAVDVASGTEASPGKKDHEKVRQFIANAKGGVG
jgi:phosphoribosylanthranilate isomerase